MVIQCGEKGRGGGLNEVHTEAYIHMPVPGRTARGKECYDKRERI